MAEASRRWVEGIFELSWPWPLADDALGLKFRLRLNGCTAHVTIPAQSKENSEVLSGVVSNNILAEAPHVDPDFQWGARNGETRYDIFAVVFRMLVSASERSLRVGDLRLAITDMDFHLAWSTGLPLGLRDRIHVHHVPLWSAAEKQIYYATSQRLERGGLGSGATRHELQTAADSVSSGEPVALAKYLWCQAKSAHGERADRRAVIEGLSSAEVAFEQSIQRLLAADLGEPALSEILKAAGGITGKHRLLRELDMKLPKEFPSVRETADVAGIRNRTVHSGQMPKPSEVRKVMTYSRHVIVGLLDSE